MTKTTFINTINLNQTEVQTMKIFPNVKYNVLEKSTGRLFFNMELDSFDVKRGYLTLVNIYKDKKWYHTFTNPTDIQVHPVVDSRKFKNLTYKHHGKSGFEKGELLFLNYSINGEKIINQTMEASQTTVKDALKNGSKVAYSLSEFNEKDINKILQSSED